jgi:hypothetical protein
MLKPVTQMSGLLGLCNRGSLFLIHVRQPGKRRLEADEYSYHFPLSNYLGVFLGNALADEL